MAARLVNIVIDARQPRRLAEFWSALLDWPVAVDQPAEVDVRAPADQGWALDLVFVPVPAPAPGAATGKNRVHLDLTSPDPAGQRALVDRAVGLGARPVDIGQGAVPWEVLADPEGNEFCVLEPRAQYRQAGALAAVVVDARDPVALVDFWGAAAGWRIGKQDGRYIGLHAPNARGPWLEFLPAAEPKTGKNRLHLDIAPAAGEDHAAEVARVRGLGARPVDVGQGAVPWEVLADPEGNEFCVLSPR